MARTGSRALFTIAALACLAGCAGRESLQASFDHSEWHAPSMLRLDVASGGFQAEFRDGTRAVGRFSGEEMREIRSRLAAARAAGFAAPHDDERIIISNGGTPTLALKGGAVALAAPADYSDWTAEAYELQDYIERRLDARGDEWSMPRLIDRRGRIG